MNIFHSLRQLLIYIPDMKRTILFLIGILVIGFSLDAQKSYPNNWFNLDLLADGFPGCSAEKTYTSLLNNSECVSIHKGWWASLLG